MADAAIITSNVVPGTTVTSGVTSGSTVSSTVSTSSANTANVVAGGVGATGATGATGAAGADGQGVPVGGTTGQVLSKNSNTDYDTEWSTVSGTGDVVGPASATDNAVVRFDSTTGKLVQNSAVTIADTTGDMAGVGTLNTHTIPGGTDTLVGRATTDTLTNKTLTSPKIDAFKDTNGVKIVEYTPNASGVNYLTQRAGSTGQAVLLSAESVTDTDVYLNLQSQGAGTVRANGVDVVTTSGTQTLTNKTLTSPVINTPTGIVKGDVGLGNVDNTSNATERAAVATLTNKDLSSGTNTFPTLNQNTTGSAAKWTTARNLAGNSTDGSANVAFANKFIVQGTTDAGLSAAQFLGTLGTGLVKNTTTTGVLSIATSGTDYAPATSGSAILKGNGSGGFSSASAGTDYTSPSSTETMTNKRITKRTGTTTSSATPTINTDNVDFYSLTAQAVDITSFTTNLSGTPTTGQTLWIAITGTAARAITWGASFEASTVALPTTTVSTNRLDVGFIWTGSIWRCIAVA